MAIKIIFFNHKGGVSKTTTTFHLGWMMANKGKRVLLVDADPQCNLTGMFLDDEAFDDYYVNPDTKNNNIKDGVKVAFEGKPMTISPVTCVQNNMNSRLFLLPGHANLSEYDAALSFAQTSNNAISTLQNLPGAFNELIEKTAEHYSVDYVFIDLNPGLSAINQNLFISSDAFIVPSNPDPFSVMAINTLVNVLPRWIDWADTVRPIFSEAAYPLSNSRPKLIGTLIQRFNIRKGRAARPYRDSINEIKVSVKEKLYPALKRHGMTFDEVLYTQAHIPNDFTIAEIPDFQGLIQKANLYNVPVFQISDASLIQSGETGVVLEGSKRSRENFKSMFNEIADKIIAFEQHAKRV